MAWSSLLPLGLGIPVVRMAQDCHSPGDSSVVVLLARYIPWGRSLHCSIVTCMVGVGPSLPFVCSFVQLHVMKVWTLHT